MSATSPPSSTGAAPWKSTLNSHIDKMESPEFVLSTLEKAPAGSPTPYLPRARTVIFRGFWTELPKNEHNKAPKNAKVYESDLPILTTDIRMQKVGQIFSSSAGHATTEEEMIGSGGGGPVEAVFWVKEVMTQWRMKGTAYVVAQDIDEGQSSGVRTVKSEIGARMRVLDESAKAEWSWKREMGAIFANQSPAIRGSFKAPPPGQATSKPFDNEELSLKAKAESLEDPIAGANFRVIIIKPDEVEQIDLSDPATSRRRVYRFNEKSTNWEEEEQWP